MICDLCEQDYDGEHTPAQCEANLLDWICETEREAERVATSYAEDVRRLRGLLAKVRRGRDYEAEAQADAEAGAAEAGAMQADEGEAQWEMDYAADQEAAWEAGQYDGGGEE